MNNQKACMMPINTPVNKSINKSLNLLRFAISSISIAGVSTVWAASEFGLDVGLGAERHSNAALVSSNEKADTARLADLNLTWRDSDSALKADVGYGVQRRDFIDNVQTDQTSVDGRAALKWDVAPKVFDVIVQHQISQTLGDQRLADTTNNRERRSVLTGGVDGYLHLSTVDAIVISPRYTDVKFNHSTQSNSQRAGTDIDWQHQISAVSSLGVSTNYTQAKFDDSSQDYNSSSVELNFATALARLSYSVAGGYNWIKRDNFADANGYTAKLVGAYKGEGFEMGGSLVRELTDTSIGLSQQSFSIANFTANDSNFNQPDIVTRTQADLYARWDLSQSTHFNAGIGATTDDYRVTLRDQDQYSAQVGVAHELSSRWSVDLSDRYQQTKFLDDPTNLEYKEMILTAGARCQLNPKLSLRFELSRLDRKANVSTAEYTDKVGLVSVNYRLF